MKFQKTVVMSARAALISCALSVLPNMGFASQPCDAAMPVSADATCVPAANPAPLTLAQDVIVGGQSTEALILSAGRSALAQLRDLTTGDADRFSVIVGRADHAPFTDRTTIWSGQSIAAGTDRSRPFGLDVATDLRPEILDHAQDSIAGLLPADDGIRTSFEF